MEREAPVLLQLRREGGTLTARIVALRVRLSGRRA